MAKDAPLVLAINGSHRAEKGFTEIALRRFLEGVAAAGGRHEVLYPARMNVNPCQSCGQCLIQTPGECPLRDDMRAIMAKLNQATHVVWASPVYFGGMTSQLKQVIERLRCILGAHFDYRGGRTYHLRDKTFEQKVVTLFTAGNPERASFNSISAVFRRIIANMEWTPAGELCFPASHLLAVHPERLADQLEAVTQAGRQFAAQGAIGQALLDRANRDYLDDPQAVLKEMTQAFLQMRREHQARSQGRPEL